MGFKEWPLIVQEKGDFLKLPHFMGYYYTKKLILAKTELSKNDFGEDLPQKAKESTKNDLILAL